MSIDKQSEIAANLQIGPTSLGMVRIYVEAEGVDLPLDFEPEEAEEIAEGAWAVGVGRHGLPASLVWIRIRTREESHGRHSGLPATLTTS